MESIQKYMARMHSRFEDDYRSETATVVEDKGENHEIIPVSLVGQEIKWRFIKPIKEVSNPSSSEIRYSDSYLVRLNASYPLKGSECDFPKPGRAENLFRCTIESPFERAIPECLLGDILRSSAFAGEWQPSIVNPFYIKDEFLRTPQAYLSRVASYNPTTWTGDFPKTFLSALALAKHEGYVFTVADAERVAIVPSQKAVEFFMERARKVRASL